MGVRAKAQRAAWDHRLPRGTAIRVREGPYSLGMPETPPQTATLEGADNNQDSHLLTAPITLPLDSRKRQIISHSPIPPSFWPESHFSRMTA